MAPKAKAKAAAAEPSPPATPKKKEPEKKSVPVRPPRPLPPGVKMQSLMAFLFPVTLEQPQCTGRLELFAKYGPVNDEGKLKGGIKGDHVHSDLEIRQMIRGNTQEALFSVCAERGKDRSTAEVIVETLINVAMDHQYTVAEVKKMLRDVPTDQEGRMNFTAMQRVILAAQRQRLMELFQDGALRERPMKVPYQNKAAYQLTGVFRQQKRNPQEEALFLHKRLNGYATLCADLEDQNNPQLPFNVTICRDRGSINDRWDRYCSLRRTGKTSYVSARNSPRDPGIGGNLADKQEGASSLMSSSVLYTPRRR
eukprot:TRINITY_DN103801_c0_g1_i1.p1 TRINITY_DN103801_c0_g1~~TRINITY_DN103801_c0_g1_i1.p1  ORF type:complete len:310 (+),score=71.96 TRINITY_DN103801_c0_g1_i1:68-997(+)